MKKSICLVIVAMLILALAGCASQGTTTKAPETTTSVSKVVTVIGWGNGAEMDTHKAKVDLFNTKKIKGIQASIEVVPNAEYMTKLNAMLSANTAPDVIMESADFNGFYYRNGNFENLTPYVERDKLDLSAILVPGVDSGNVYGDNYREALPFTGNSMVIAYNKTLFDTMKIPYPQNSWTWDDFLNVCKKLTTGSGAEKQYAICDHWAVRIYAPYTFGGSLYSIAGTPAMHASDEKTIKGVKFWADLQRYGYMPDSAAAQGMPSEQRFFGGKAGMIFFFTWDAENFSSSIGTNFAWSAVELPSDAAGQKKTLSWTTGLAINKASSNKEAAWEYVKFACLDAESNALNSAVGIPIINSMIESYGKKTIKNTDISLSMFCNVFKYGVINPLGGSFSEFSDEYTRYWDKIILEGASAADMMAELQKTGQPILDKLTKSK
jgi:multiple sugar transport system substrate-binding protein